MWYRFKPYVPVHVRRAKAAREMEKQKKKGQVISPVVLQGRNIASTFWGKAWCENLESYSDYANRLPRGRTYIRNGSVVDLQIQQGKIKAMVSGSSLYTVTIHIEPLPNQHWHGIKSRCAGAIGSLVELLQGRLSKGVMDIVTARSDGLFPKPREIKLSCSCPDWAGMCKHVAAVMYGVGARLDQQPELLFLLRKVDHLELIEEAVPQAGQKTATGKKTLGQSEIAGVFGIELAEPEVAETTSSRPKARPEQLHKNSGKHVSPKQRKGEVATRSAKAALLAADPPSHKRLGQKAVKVKANGKTAVGRKPK